MPDSPLTRIHELWPLAVYVVSAFSLVASMIGLSYFLGERHAGRATGEPYESGVAPTGTAWIRFDIKYFLVAVFFVIFDVESIFIFAWAVIARDAGLEGYLAIVIFIGVLMAALCYLWRMGALEWGEMKRGR
jgi:NADH-quinone oxidoreductase subunit A